MRKQRIIKATLTTLFAVFLVFGIWQATRYQTKLKLKDVQLKSQQSKLLQMELDYTKLNVDLQKERDSKNQNEQHIQELEQQKKQLENDLESAQRDLQAKASRQAAEKQKLATAAQNALGSSKVYAAGCNTGNPYKDFIYMHESGCNPAAVNSLGCRGIGQACPGNKLPCGADFACQDAYFSNYAIQRYGSWANAHAFWLQHSWW